jgi:hypothetical protein
MGSSLVSQVVVVDGLVDLHGLAQVEHFTSGRDLRFINNKHPFYFE